VVETVVESVLGFCSEVRGGGGAPHTLGVLQEQAPEAPAVVPVKRFEALALECVPCATTWTGEADGLCMFCLKPGTEREW